MNTQLKTQTEILEELQFTVGEMYKKLKGFDDGVTEIDDDAQVTSEQYYSTLKSLKEFSELLMARDNTYFG